jgi:hypothetical protein
MSEEKINGVKGVDEKFDKAERIWDRTQKLLLKILGGIVGISLAIYVAYDQLRDKHEETINKIEVEKVENKEKEVPEHAGDESSWTITEKTYDIDPKGYRKGDTIYIDYYSDGYVEKYYTDGESYYEE